MAVTELKDFSSLRIQIELPMVEGKSKTRIKSYSYLKEEAVVQDVYDVANALMELQKHTVVKIAKQDNTILE